MESLLDVSIGPRRPEASQNIYLVGGLEHEFDFSIQLGISSSQLTNSIIFQRGLAATTNQLYLYIDPYHPYKSPLMGKSPLLMGRSPLLMGKSPLLMGKSP